MRKFWTAVLAVALGAGLFIGQACSPPSESDKIKDPEKLQEAPPDMQQNQDQESAEEQVEEE